MALASAPSALADPRPAAGVRGHAADRARPGSGGPGQLHNPEVRGLAERERDRVAVPDHSLHGRGGVRPR